MFFYAECYTKSKPAESLLPAQSVDKPKNLFLRRYRRFFCFSADKCGGKTPSAIITESKGAAISAVTHFLSFLIKSCLIIQEKKSNISEKKKV